MKEVEIKALLNEDKYRYLKGLLPARFRKINEDNVTTVKFRPTDVRVRYSDKVKEVVWKDTDPTELSRKEVSINLNSVEDCHKMIALLDAAGLQQHPSWTTERADFVCEMGDHEYILSLQHIPNFAYILEAEIMTEEPDKHIPNLKKILTTLGCEPLDADEFKAKIKDYIEKYSKK
jgi:adenylate cyclase class IV